VASRRHERADRKGKAAPPAGERAAEAASWPRLLPFAALVVATFLAYRPAWHGGLLWDDAAHVTRPHLRTVGGLLRIWLEPGATQQYYPLTHSAFWLQSRLWGDETLGSHLVGIALHLLAALLLYAGLRRLEVPGALLSAAVFALHPVQVESVAWIAS
jgi:hypothetical protein